MTDDSHIISGRGWAGLDESETLAMNRRSLPVLRDEREITI